MKKLIATIVTALMLMPSLSYAQSIGNDKYQHAGVAAALNLGLQEAGVKKQTAWCIVGAVLVGKELYDSRHRDRHTPELADIGAGLLGMAASEGVIWLVHKTW